ncbi:trigger factor [Cerasibacillus terrae]|uniref:Trigger factor n=1 Tax=Cerasibacillus terrae TaxID=2498845 RepID=A0A5C8NP10_9BACI|nr:trigger factor [Cerasibacillus terrae]TXL62561.1 trigger factor [Cerasibacillus terrae]
MTAKWEKQEGNDGVLTFEVSAEKFEEGLDKAFKKVVKDVQIPGFRKGKVPRVIFEKRFGVEALYQDAIDFVLPEAYTGAVEETGIEPVDQPSIDIEEIERGKSLVFTADVTVKPEVKLGDYKGLEVEEQDVNVTDEDVEEEIKREQERLAELVVKEEGAVEEGDTVVIDFEGFVDDVAFEGGKGEDHSLEIGSGQFIPGFEEQLIGKETGAETDVKVTFPEEYHAEDLAGKEAVFKVTIHEIKTKELPEIDDEFAKDIDDDVETLDELKAKKKEDLEAQKKQDAENKTKNTLIEKAVTNAEADVPEAMIHTEVDRMLQELQQNLQMQGMTMDMYYQFSGQNEAGLRDQMQDDAKNRVMTSLTLEKIAEVEDLKPTDEDVDAELDRMANMYGVEKAQIEQMLGGNTEMVKGDLKVQKAIDFLVQESKTI